jgi:hypothetical protein
VDYGEPSVFQIFVLHEGRFYRLPWFLCYLPFCVQNKWFICTVTVTKASLDQRWWFPSCSMCHKSAKRDGYKYKCSDDACSSVDADLM